MKPKFAMSSLSLNYTVTRKCWSVLFRKNSLWHDHITWFTYNLLSIGWHFRILIDGRSNFYSMVCSHSEDFPISWLTFADVTTEAPKRVPLKSHKHNDYIPESTFDKTPDFSLQFHWSRPNYTSSLDKLEWKTYLLIRFLWQSSIEMCSNI